MTDRAALICSILSSPHDDVPRLIFADWLDEHGEVARAEFVRVQCELARRCDEPVYGCESPTKSRHPIFGQRMHACEKCSVCELRRRERELWDSWPDKNDMRSKIREECPVVKNWIVLPERLILWREPEMNLAGVSRGFVSAIICSWSDFLSVHESLIWSPEQFTVCRCQQHNSASMQRKTCVLCKDGRIPRPFVATAQPITDVVLTTWPTWLENRTHFDAVRLGVNSFVTTVTTDGHRFDRVKCETCGGCGWAAPVRRYVYGEESSSQSRCETCHGIPPNSWTCPAWPGVKFAMPNSGDPS